LWQRSIDTTSQLSAFVTGNVNVSSLMMDSDAMW